MKNKNGNGKFRQKVLPLALTAALAMMAQKAEAQATINGGSSGVDYTFDNSNSPPDLFITGSVVSSGGVAIDVFAGIGTLDNSGTIRGTGSPGIGGMPNGAAGGDGYGISNTGAIGELINRNGGTISGIGGNGTSATTMGGNGGGGQGITNTGSIGMLDNAGGTISGIGGNGGSAGAWAGNGGDGQGIANTGHIGTLENDGTISGTGNENVVWSFYVGAGGNGYGINNAGTITNLDNHGAIDGFGGIAGSAYATSAQNVSGGAGYGLNNSGAIGSLTNRGTISGTGGRTGDGFTPGSNTHQVSGGGTGDGGNGYGIHNAGMIATLDNGGTISGAGGDAGMTNRGFHGGRGGSGYGIDNAVGGIIGTLTNTGTISGLGALAGPTAWMSGSQSGGSGYGINNAGVITALANSGVVNGNGWFGKFGGSGYGIANSGSIATLTNSTGASVTGTGSVGFTISAPGAAANTDGNGYGVDNTGTITTLANGGGISGIGAAVGISLSLANSGDGYGYAIRNDGTITTLVNSGTLSGNGGASGFPGYATPDHVFRNGGTGGNGYGIGNSGSIVTLRNTGTISGTGAAGGSNIGGVNGGTAYGGVNGGTGGNGYGISNTGAITTLDNMGGTISGAAGSGGTGNRLGANGDDGSGYGIYNAGSIGKLANSGLISGPTYAVYNDISGTIGTIVNSGTIAGNILNASGNDLLIDGGMGTAFGTLTGYNGAVGTITNSNTGSLANVVFASGNLLLNDNIVLASNGTASGNVKNTGAVLQVNQRITITGNYVQTGGTLQIGAVSSAQSGQLMVTGNTTMTSGTVSIVPAGYALAAGQRYVAVDTAGKAVYGPGLTYSAGNLTGTGTGTTADGHSYLVVTLGEASASTPPTAPTPPEQTIPALAPNAQSAFSGLSRYTGFGDAGLLNLYNASLALEQDAGAGGAANHAGKQLNPLTQAAASSATTAWTASTLDIVSNRSDAVRLAQAGASDVPIAERRPVSGVWSQAFGGHASQNERDQVDGYSANFGGLVVGADRAINEAWRAGGALSYGNALVNNTGDTSGSSTRVNSYGLLGYSSYTARAWYANLSAGVVRQHYDTNRNVDFTGFSGQADGSFNGTQYVARAEAGRPLALGVATVTPLARLTYSYLHQDAYTESGGNGAALAVDSTHLTSVNSDFGVKLTRDLWTSFGVLTPELQLAWRHEYVDSRARTQASFAADPTGQTSFTSLGSSPVTDLAVVSAGVTLMRAKNLSLSVRYELQAGSGYVAQGGSLRLRQLF